MRKRTMPSAAIAACTALLIAATVGQASADTTDEPAPSRLVAVKGKNNNVAGNDLTVGNNNTSGTGHSIGRLQDDGVAQATVNVYNCSGSTFTISEEPNNPRTSGDWLSPQATPPASIASHPATLNGDQCLTYPVSANWTSATTDEVLTSDAIYDISSGGSIEFDAIVDPSGDVSADCPTIGTAFTCAWITSSDEPGIAVVNFIVVPGA
ncbi:hypothetical protein ACFV16_33955 [Streptomyces massasporeus]|uniref:hypothetical protein n=1 Tax=Streptomyces massasporeus TaxID=67324 RepID=UPI00369EEB61